MIDVKIEGKLGTSAADAIEPHARALYDREGCRVLAIVELADTERNKPVAGRDKASSVKMQIISLEIPTQEQENVIREAQRALHLQRTASGTLDESGQIELSGTTLKHLGAVLHDYEVARLRAGLNHWARVAHQAVTSHPTHTEALRHLKEISKGLGAVLDRAAIDDQD